MKTPIQNALPIVAAAYGEKFGIQVLFHGKQAKTDGKTIILPAVEINSPNDKAVMWGYLAHEAAHIRYTDFSLVAKINQPIKHALLNIAEDIRIELCLAKTYPGTLKTINAVITHLVESKEICYPKQDSPVNLLQMMCLLTLRLNCLKQTALAPIQKQVEDEMIKVFPEHFNQFLMAHFMKVPNLSSTQEALDWVNVLLSNVLSLPEQKNEGYGSKHQHNKKIEPSISQSNSKSNDFDLPNSKSNNDNETKQQSNQKRPSILPDEDKKYEMDNQIADQNPDSPNHNSREDNYPSLKSGNQHPKEVHKCFEKIASAIINAHPDDIQEDIFTKVANKINRVAKKSVKKSVVDISKVEIARAYNGKAELNSIKLAMKESSLLRLRLRNWLVSLQQTKPVPKQKGQRLMTKRLGLSQAGETRIFQQHTFKTAPNADIHLLVDRSSSMNRITNIHNTTRSYSDIANQAALSLALALEGIVGISLAVTYFGKAGNTPALTSVLRPNELVSTNASKFYQYANGNTPMAEGIWFAVHDLLKQKNKRKIIIVVTDGKPSCTEQALEIIKMCGENRFEIIGIGIQEEYVRTLFPHSIVINDPAQLKNELFKTLKNILTL
ncbi:VWA domain-containing protein [Thorsellia kenyensis]|uniref:VWA domain-containing protein n=1 Tax=Thorsellia kenyensis TaxID=1549888 RepID=A0ABV6C974_9GAMM